MLLPFNGSPYRSVFILDKNQRNVSIFYGVNYEQYERTLRLSNSTVVK